jgi:hypothetical protein
VISRGEFYWILLAATEDLSDKFLGGGGWGWGHMFYMYNKTSIRLNVSRPALQFPMTPSSAFTFPHLALTLRS